MIPSPENVHRGRYLLLLTGLYVVFFILGMMAVGSFNLPAESLRWVRAGVIVVCLLAANSTVRRAARRGRPRWLLKTPPSPPQV